MGLANLLFLSLPFFAGVFGYICCIRRCELRQRVDCWESVHFHFSFQRPQISPCHVAHAHCIHCASKKNRNHDTVHAHIKPTLLICWLTFQTGVSKKRLEKFLGGEDLDSSIVHHDPSFSRFLLLHALSSKLFSVCWAACTSCTYMYIHLYEPSSSVFTG